MVLQRGPEVTQWFAGLLPKAKMVSRMSKCMHPAPQIASLRNQKGPAAGGAALKTFGILLLLLVLLLLKPSLRRWKTKQNVLKLLEICF